MYFHTLSFHHVCVIPRNMWEVRLLLKFYGAIVYIMVDVVPVVVAVLQVHVNLLGVDVRLLGECTTPISVYSSSISTVLLIPLVMVASFISLAAIGLLGPLLLGSVDFGWWRWSLKWRLWHEVSCLRWHCYHP